MTSRSLDSLRKFVNEHKRVVIKPLDQMVGRSVFVTGADDPNRNELPETITNHQTRYVMAQRYIPEVVDSGDARILLIDGKPVPHALVRMLPKYYHRGNISSGATTHSRPLTNSEQEICEQVGPVLRKKGLLFAGIDVIGQYQTEISVNSPTGIHELDRQCELDIAGDPLQTIESHRQQRRTS